MQTLVPVPEPGALSLVEAEENRVLGSCFDFFPRDVAVVDGEARYLYANSKYCALKHTPAEIVGRTVGENLPGYRTLVQQKVTSVLERGEGETGVPFAGYLSANGDFRSWTLSFSPLLGSRPRVLIVVEDDPAEDQDARRAHELHFLFSSFLEQASDAIFVKGVDGRYRYINPAGARMLGKKVAEVTGQDDFALFGPETATEMRDRERFILRRGTECTYFDEDTVADGRIVFRSTKVPLRTLSGEVIGIAGVSRDVTEEKLREEETARLVHELAAAKRALEEERELRENLVVSLGHDLRSPLMIAKMAAQFIAEERRGPVSELDFVAKLRAALDRVDHMVRDLLDSSRLRAGQGLAVRPVRTELSDVLRATVQELELIYPGRLQVDLPAEKVHGQWDPTAIQRVVENLVHNAIRYGGPGQPVTVSAGLGERRDCAWFEVHNHGDPMPESMREQLFRRFQRGENLDRGPKCAGWGLGLMIVKSLVDVQGGRVDLRSDAEHGTVFRIWLPLREDLRTEAISMSG